MKTLNLALIFSLFIFGIYGATITWNGTFTTGDWATGSNWVGGSAPGSGDTAQLVATTIVTVSSSITVDQLFTAANSKITVLNGGTLNIQNNVTQAGVFNIQTEATGVFNCAQYFVFSGENVNFYNLGSTTLIPYVSGAVTQGKISNVGSNNVVFKAGSTSVINNVFYIPSGFQYDSSAAQTFLPYAGAGAITFAYTETIPTAGWTFNNDNNNPISVTFNVGANINGNVAVTTSNIANARPQFTFFGASTVGTSATLEVVPKFGSGVVTFNGGSASFNIYAAAATIQSSNVQGSTILQFQNNLQNGFPTTLSFGGGSTISIDSPGFNFTGNWIFSGQPANFSTPRNINFNLTVGNAISFLKPTTFTSSAVLLNGGGSIIFTDGFSSANTLNFPLAPTFACTVANNNQFAVGGSPLIFPSLTIYGCALSTSASLTLNTQLTTNFGNTTLPSNNIVINGTAFTFQGSAGTLYSISFLGAVSIPLNTTYTATNVEVIFPSGNFLNVGDNSVLASSGNGLFTLNGGIALGKGNSISATTAFPSGNSNINTNDRANWSGTILLRNTILGGNGDVWFTGSLLALKGVSTIQNPTFRFTNGVVLSYLWDCALPNTGAQLIINSNGATGNRIIQGGVTANTQSYIVFDDNIAINVTATITTNGASPNQGTVTFRTSGQTQATLSTNNTVTLFNYIYFNHSNFHLTGLGNFVFSSASIYLQGGLNYPAASGDAIVTTSGTLYVGVVVNSTIGNTVTINAGLTTDDLDNNPLTASTTLTLYSVITQTRTIAGAYSLGANLIFGGNVLVNSASTINTLGFLQILGSSLVLGASPTWNNKVILPSTFTISSGTTAYSLTLGEQTPVVHGFNVPSTLTINTPATLVLNGLYSVTFQGASTVSGSGVLIIINAIVTDNAAVTISPQTVTLNNVTFVGTGNYAISPVDQTLNTNSYLRAFVSTVYSGSTLNLQSQTTITPLFTFTANPLTIQGNSAFNVSTGSYTVNSRWILNNPFTTFLAGVTLGTSGSFAGQGVITFNISLALTQSTTISNNVIFGSSNNYVVTVSNGGFTLTLTGTSITVASIVVSSGGSIVSTSPNPPTTYQLISGGGVINSDWTWSNPVQFGALNVTGARTLTFNLALSDSVKTYFTSGVTFNGGTFVATSSGAIPLLDVETSITTNVVTNLGPQIHLYLTGATFSFLGTSVLTINGTVDCNTPVTFTQNVIFGCALPTSNVLNLNAGTTGWSPASASIQIWRSNVNVAANVNANILPSLIFGLNGGITFSVAGGSNLYLLGNLNVLGTSFTGSGSLFVGPITITSAQNNTLSGITLLGTLTFNSTTSPWVEPFFSPSSSLNQAIVLNGPIRMNSPTFTGNAQINGPSRIAITNSLSVNTAFTFNTAVQLYVTTTTSPFTINLSSAQSYLTFTSTPSLFNPLGYNLNSNTNFIFNSVTTYNIFKFNLNSAFNIGTLNLNGGVLQLTGSSTSASIVNVASTATLWIDGNTFTATEVIFSQNPDGTNPSYYQLTISSLNPPAITTGAVVYKGVASLVVNNFNWDGTPVTGITATSSNGATANFVSVIGTPGYTYTSTRNGNNVQFSRSANPTLSPSPTQSNGPSPGVSSSNIISINMILFFAIFVIYFIF